MTVTMKNQNKAVLNSPILILLSAAMFGFFGFFYLDWNKPFPDGQVVLFMVLLGWTLKISALVFLAAGILAFLSPIAGNLLYALAGVGSAGLFVVVAVMDLTDSAHMIMPYAPAVLLLFAAWNGFASWSALRSIIGSQDRPGFAAGGPAPTGGQ